MAAPSSLPVSSPPEGIPAGTTTTGVRPMRSTPGGGLAALLEQNRKRLAKPGGVDVKVAPPEQEPAISAGRAVEGGDGGVASPNQDRATSVGISFDALEVTAVGDVIGEKNVPVADPKGSGAVRVPRLTPRSGGLAERLARARTEIGSRDSGDKKTPVGLWREHAAPTAAFDEPEITAVDPAVGEKEFAVRETQGPVAQGPVTQGPVTQGPVAQGPVTQGPVAQGPVTQGPITVSQDPVVVRPKHVTPGSGALAALLEQTRNRIGQQGQHDQHDRPPPLVASESIVPSARFVDVHSAESGVPEAIASVPQKKNPGFAATLLGVPAPVIDLLGRRAYPGSEAQPRPRKRTPFMETPARRQHSASS